MNTDHAWSTPCPSWIKFWCMTPLNICYYVTSSRSCAGKWSLYTYVELSRVVTTDEVSVYWSWTVLCDWLVSSDGQLAASSALSNPPQSSAHLQHSIPLPRTRSLQTYAGTVSMQRHKHSLHRTIVNSTFEWAKQLRRTTVGYCVWSPSYSGVTNHLRGALGHTKTRTFRPNPLKWNNTTVRLHWPNYLQLVTRQKRLNYVWWIGYTEKSNCHN